MSRKTTDLEGVGYCEYCIYNRREGTCAVISRKVIRDNGNGVGLCKFWYDFHEGITVLEAQRDDNLLYEAMKRYPEDGAAAFNKAKGGI